MEVFSLTNMIKHNRYLLKYRSTLSGLLPYFVIKNGHIVLSNNVCDFVKSGIILIKWNFWGNWINFTSNIGNSRIVFVMKVIRLYSPFYHSVQMPLYMCNKIFSQEKINYMLKRKQRKWNKTNDSIFVMNNNRIK